MYKYMSIIRIVQITEYDMFFVLFNDMNLLVSIMVFSVEHRQQNGNLSFVEKLSAFFLLLFTFMSN